MILKAFIINYLKYALYFYAKGLLSFAGL